MIFQIKLVEKVFRIKTVFDFSYYYSFDFLSQENHVDFYIEINMEEIETEYYRIRQLPSERTPAKNIRFILGQIEHRLLLQKIAEIIPLYSAFLFHGTIVTDYHYGYMFTAPSGTGKTTRAKLFIETIPGAKILNGDKPMLADINDRIIAYDTPWRGKEHMGINSSVPLGAIMIVERKMADEKDSIVELKGKEAFPALLQQIYIPYDDISRKETMRFLNSLDQKIKIYRFRGDPTPEAIKMAYDIVKK